MSTDLAIPSNLSLTTSRAAALPFYLAVPVALYVAASSYVRVEPAPCDYVFLALPPLLVVTGHAILQRHIHAVVYLGLVLFVAANFISLPMCADLAWGTRYLGITLYMVAIWFVFVAIVGRYGPSSINLVVRAFIIGALLAAVIGVLARFDLIPAAEQYMLDESRLRIKSTFKDPNVFSPFLVAATMLTISQMLVRRRVTMMGVICLTLFGCGILFAFSRGAFVHLFVSLVVFAALHVVVGRHRDQLIWMAIRTAPLLLAIVVVALLALQETELTDYLGSRMSLQDYDSERFTVQRAVLSKVQDVPVGLGPGQWTKAQHIHDVHNLYLRVWAENGAMGLLGLLVFLGGWLASVWDRIRRRGQLTHFYIVFAAIVMGIMVESMVIDTIHWRHFFLMLAIPIGLVAYERTAGGADRSPTARAARHSESRTRIDRPADAGSVAATSAGSRNDVAAASVSHKKIAVVVPCYNEAGGVRKLLQTLDRFELGPGAQYTCQFVLVDDGSTDGTGELLKTAAANRPRYKFVSHTENRGIAAAIHTGLRHADAEIVCSIDSDGTYDPQQLEAMIPRLSEGVSLVVGSPYHREGAVSGAPAWRIALSRLASLLYRRPMRNKLSCYTSCFRVYRRCDVAPLELHHSGFVGVVELLWRLDRRGARIVEVPAVLTTRTVGTSKMKLLRTVAGHSRFLCHVLTTCVGNAVSRRTPVFPVSRKSKLAVTKEVIS